MNLRRRHRVAAEVNTSSINDIMFFLMLFFLIASTIVNPNVVKLLLPRSPSGQAVSKKQVAVALTKDLRYFVNNRSVSEQSLPDELKKEAEKAGGQVTILFRVDKTLDIQRLVNFMAIVSKLKLKMVLAVDKG